MSKGNATRIRNHVKNLNKRPDTPTPKDWGRAGHSFCNKLAVARRNSQLFNDQKEYANGKATC